MDTHTTLARLNNALLIPGHQLDRSRARTSTSTRPLWTSNLARFALVMARMRRFGWPGRGDRYWEHVASHAPGALSVQDCCAAVGALLILSLLIYAVFK